MSSCHDVVIVGAGVLGCMAARELSRYRLDICVLERFDDVGEGSSKANSGLIQAGFHPRARSLKGLSCVEGNAAYTRICSELHVPLERPGSLYVAFTPDGLSKTREKYEKGVANGAPGLKMISGEEARAIEPRLSEQVIGALWAPTTGIISPFALVDALARAAAANGVEFRFLSEVCNVERSHLPASFVAGAHASAHHGGPVWDLALSCGTHIYARYVLNTAGDNAELLDAQVHPADLEIRPRRGQFYVFDKQDPARAITHPVYQAQDTDEGGTLVTPSIDGNLIAGPTSENVRDYTHTETTAAGLEHVRRVAFKLFPDLDLGEVITNFAGVRTNIVNLEKELKDFVVRTSAPGFVSALGIKNPGMTSAPALVRMAIGLLSDEGLELVDDPGFVAELPARTPFLRCAPEEQAALLACDPSYAHVVCRCEQITEGDIRHLFDSPLAPRSLEGVKRRLRTGMGRCQGGFCTPRIASLLARELGVRLEDVPANGAGGKVVLRRAR